MDFTYPFSEGEGIDSKDRELSIEEEGTNGRVGSDPYFGLVFEPLLVPLEGPLYD
jgi:hypothetical protein